MYIIYYPDIFALDGSPTMRSSSRWLTKFFFHHTFGLNSFLSWVGKTTVSRQYPDRGCDSMARSHDNGDGTMMFYNRKFSSWWVFFIIPMPTVYKGQGKASQVSSSHQTQLEQQLNLTNMPVNKCNKSQQKWWTERKWSTGRFRVVQRREKVVKKEEKWSWEWRKNVGRCGHFCVCFIASKSYLS